MAKANEIKNYVDSKIETELLENIMGDRFGRYSKYIIQERALPDVRDGLKPVQRRILYAMHMLKMHSDSPYRKCARIAGEVMGKYHPHGDSSIYEAMVRLSQDWKINIPLIDMQGNNGSIDGDSPAAMRYTEARLSKAAELMLENIDPRIKTVPFVPNFDDNELEPVVLPSKFPNLLVNGATGISAGYATDIPPHNLKEVIDAVIARIDNPEITLDEIMLYIKGPDFPTGGIIQGVDGIRQAFETGRGKIIVRSKTHIEEGAKGIIKIVVTEIPYEVNKAELVKSIDQLRADKVIDGILEVRDESDRDGLRICIDLKKESNPEIILNFLLKKTNLQSSYNYNMVAIHGHRPVLMPLVDILDAYILHQKDFITNRCNYELINAKARLHIVDGFMKMVSILDAVITEIRASKGKADAKQRLIEKFEFSPEQAEAIVMLQLYRLSSTDVLELQKEQAELNKQIANLEGILSSEKKLLGVIKKELQEVSKISNERRTVIEQEAQQIKISEIDLVTNEQVMVAVTKEGYVKRSSMKSYKSSKSMGIKENDAVIFLSECQTLNTLLLFTNLGNFIYYPIYKLDDQKWGDIGIYINNLVPIQGNEKIVRAYVIDDWNKPLTVLIGTKNGLVKQVDFKDFNISRYTKAVRAMNLKSNDEVVSVDMANNYPCIVCFTSKGKVIRFKSSEVSVVGTQAGGVKGITTSDKMACAIYTRNSHDLIILTSRGNVKRVKASDIKLSKRGQTGISVIKEIKTNPHYIVSAASMSYNQYQSDVKVFIVTDKGNFETTAFNFKYENDKISGSPVKGLVDKPELIYLEKLDESEIFDEEVEEAEVVDDAGLQISIFDDDFTF